MKDSTKNLLVVGAGLATFLVGLSLAAKASAGSSGAAKFRGIIGDRKAYRMAEVGPTMYQVAFHVVDPANGLDRVSWKTNHYIDLPTASTDIVYANEPYPSNSVTQEQASSAQLYAMDQEISRYIAENNPTALDLA